MILTITLNPSIDRRYDVKDFEKGKVFRTEDYQYTVGGKGLNVSKVIKSLGEEVIATGFLGGNSGKYILDGLDKMNIDNDFINIAGETRSCLAIISNDGSQTEILETGPLISEDEKDEFLNVYEKLLDRVDIVCASGSLPKGLKASIYNDLIKIANKNNKKFLLDTSGEALKLGIEAGPYLIKPNKEELEILMGISMDSEETLIDAGKSLLKKGIEIVVFSLGENGALLFNKNDVYKLSLPNIKLINPVGSGDAMIAGMAVAISKGMNDEGIIKLGAACGTANAMESETGKVDKDNVLEIMEQIKIERIY